jgi:NAD-dependent SIR2 family protein deacetylase
MELHSQLYTAAERIRNANGLLITAGAGMAVDSGLPDFRSEDDFWRAHPGLRADGIGFQDIATSEAFRRDPVRAWGFYGHRVNLYRRAVPHEGLEIFRRWASTKEYGAFVVTSSFDGKFQKARFEENRIHECRGSIHRLQCSRPCSHETWPAEDVHPEVDEEHCRLLSELPRCLKCGGVARPNVLMFDDCDWVETRVKRQRMRFEQWLLRADKIVVIELGADETIPTVRNVSERTGSAVIRISPYACEIDLTQGISIDGSALETIAVLATTANL